MLWPRLNFILDRGLTCANVLEKSIAAYGASFEVLRFSGSLRAYGVSGSALTLGELQQVVNRISAALLHAGLRRHERVAICKRHEVDYLLLSLAIIRAGGITVPINGSMAPADLRAYLAYTGARFVLVDANTAGHLDTAALAAGTLQAVCTSGDTPPGVQPLSVFLAIDASGFLPVDIAVGDDVMIVHTSGTTGTPKGVLHGSDSIVRATRGQMVIQPFTRHNRLMLATPTNHHITQAAIVTCLAAGLPAYVPAGEQGGALLALLTRDRSSIVMAFPDVYQSLCDSDLAAHDLSRVKAWMAAGDSSHEVHIRQLTQHGAFARLFGRRVLGSLYVEFFGSSEVGFAALLKVSTAATTSYARCVGWRTPVSPRVKVADANGRPLPRGQAGRLMVKGPTLFRGYWNLHSSLHGTLIDGWWWTGDIVRRDAWGRYYHLDRAVDVIDTAAGPVYSLPVEERLLAHPAVADVAVIAVMRNGQALAAAVIECRPRLHPSPEALAAWARSQGGEPGVLPIVLPEGEGLPRGLTGKVLKRRLRERFGPDSAMAQRSERALAISA